MKLNIRNIVAAAVVAATGLQASAQFTQSGYFIDGYTYRFQMNPAMANDKNFVAMPGLGNLNIGVQGNMGLSDVLYNVNGRTSLFLNPGVSTSEVLGNLSNMNKLNTDIKIGILAAGFRGFGGYNTVSINARVSAAVHLPKSMFSLLKEGITNKTYEIDGLKGMGNGYVEIGLGHSRDITPEWRVGGTFKILIGGANVDARLNRARLILNEDSWDIESDAKINASVKGLEYKMKLNESTGHEYVNGVDIDGPGPNGFGLGLDMGAVYTPAALPDWRFSAALLDLGFISWSNNRVATTNGLKTFKTDAYTFNVADDAPNSFDNEWDRMKDAITALYELENDGNAGSRTTGLGATLNLAAEYTLPMYKPLTFGLLNTTRIQGAYSWTDFRLSANVAPVKVFSAGINMAVGSYGAGFGWIANLHVTGFNFFLGMDHTLGKLAKQGVPLSSNAQLNLGMNFLF